MRFREFSRRRLLQSDAASHHWKLLKTSRPPSHGKTRVASSKDAGRNRYIAPMKVCQCHPLVALSRAACNAWVAPCSSAYIVVLSPRKLRPWTIFTQCLLSSDQVPHKSHPEPASEPRRPPSNAVFTYTNTLALPSASILHRHIYMHKYIYIYIYTRINRALRARKDLRSYIMG